MPNTSARTPHANHATESQMAQRIGAGAPAQNPAESSVHEQQSEGSDGACLQLRLAPPSTCTGGRSEARPPVVGSQIQVSNHRSPTCVPWASMCPAAMYRLTAAHGHGAGEMGRGVGTADRRLGKWRGAVHFRRTREESKRPRRRDKRMEHRAVRRLVTWNACLCCL